MVKKYGATPGCKGCTKIGEHHTPECRARQKHVKEDKDDKEIYERHVQKHLE